ncbi:DNA-directed RNA polymeras-like protein III 25 kDa polypeptide [Hyaloscypha bicolor E]|uniref:DNA-directed RNA polymerase subunit n=1 Tax=Hyaloscypha bicolor E TaxID=1095630 RepID=A0A2J6SGL0_9HELO|nr:DNA-directed RNA polymeras-like protein III 25 kDa polypeptide [Hyaloscypha bicolor E]PMD49905.1 DNA-directed RNA polymeras-like protein III 25 kDa polypeptide [Hyaloscypha bicolor E]
MFILTSIADLVQIHPEDFNKEASQAIEDNINAKYANKVIQKIGLCICLYDLLSASEGLIGHGTGLVNVNVEFRLIVFRPFKHEVMLGRISSATEHGIRVRTQFFDQIFIPSSNLPEGSEFLPTEQVFVWNLADGQRLYYDNQETVRFRIEEEIWTDQSPMGPKEREDAAGTVMRASAGSPYVVKGSMADAGLGPCLWWDGDEE